MAKYNLYAGLSGGFGGAVYVATEDFNSFEDAESRAREMRWRNMNPTKECTASCLPMMFANPIVKITNCLKATSVTKMTQLSWISTPRKLRGGLSTKQSSPLKIPILMRRKTNA